jgi:GAF domain-containing protein
MDTTPDGTLADPLEVIADLRRQLAERTAELDEAHARETATAEVLGVINANHGDLAPVFEAMLQKATELCEAAFGALETFDGGLFRVAATYQLPAALTDMVKIPQSAEENSIRGVLLAGAPFVHQPDMLNSEIRIAPMRGAMVELGGSRSNLAVALRKDNAFLGILWLHRQEPRAFTERQIALIQNFAAQAVIAIENARLLTEMREALEQQTATAEVLGVINSSPGDLAPVFDAMLEKAMLLCGAAFGELQTYNGEHFEMAALRGLPPR